MRIYTCGLVCMYMYLHISYVLWAWTNIICTKGWNAALGVHIYTHMYIHIIRMRTFNDLYIYVSEFYTRTWEEHCFCCASAIFIAKYICLYKDIMWECMHIYIAHMYVYIYIHVSNMCVYVYVHLPKYTYGYVCGTGLIPLLRIYIYIYVYT